jgi:hypothetical protein
VGCFIATHGFATKFKPLLLHVAAQLGADKAELKAAVMHAVKLAVEARALASAHVAGTGAAAAEQARAVAV